LHKYAGQVLFSLVLALVKQHGVGKAAAACGQEQRRVPKTKAMAKLSRLTVALDIYA